ncbi:DUF397 domain-containing protein [Micromonospora sp. NBC_01813]|uniref:DUF397 domain-containing protein n=1 Tax=Micromonospora sp. NBC_01813 TaxID=2975988 RepID=UPI002DDC7760|nr:DUF397 domain-containing protein [Micromonospora sp. NBC_01813]WSA06849.1 DUF397 domain-containing protein [Micromonospora sp. NBC_01813]
MGLDQAGAQWRKSSRSGNGNNCVEVATNLLTPTGRVLVRDSKNPTTAVLSISPNDWQAFVRGASRGRFTA